jgi:hypothetical protein
MYSALEICKRDDLDMIFMKVYSEDPYWNLLTDYGVY